ncbi:MAG: hypothetical protein WBQ94_12300 [Terracidiphilus sp.]
MKALIDSPQKLSRRTGIYDELRPGRPVSDEQIAVLLRRTLNSAAQLFYSEDRRRADLADQDRVNLERGIFKKMPPT